MGRRRHAVETWASYIVGMETMSEAQLGWLDALVGRVTIRMPGAYQATVVDAADPLAQGRIRVLVPDLGSDPAWARICLDRLSPAEPPATGASGWVMFERADPSLPVWIGSDV